MFVQRATCSSLPGPWGDGGRARACVPTLCSVHYIVMKICSCSGHAGVSGDESTSAGCRLLQGGILGTCPTANRPPLASSGAVVWGAGYKWGEMPHSSHWPSLSGAEQPLSELSRAAGLAVCARSRFTVGAAGTVSLLPAGRLWVRHLCSC
jgi:hypothetical protein